MSGILQPPVGALHDAVKRQTPMRDETPIPAKKLATNTKAGTEQ